VRGWSRHTSPIGRNVTARDRRSRGHRKAQQIHEPHKFCWCCARVGLLALSLLRPAAGQTQPICQPRRPCRCTRPCVLFILPVPSGLFHAGHVPSDRPHRRAGYARDRDVNLSRADGRKKRCISASCSDGVFRATGVSGLAARQKVLWRQRAHLPWFGNVTARISETVLLLPGSPCPGERWSK